MNTKGLLQRAKIEATLYNEKPFTWDGFMEWYNEIKRHTEEVSKKQPIYWGYGGPIIGWR